jgi:subtilisin family serine protease
MTVPPAGGGWVPYAQFIQQDIAANAFPFLDGSNQTVALIDRGVDYLMPQLGGDAGKYSKVLGGANFRPGDDPNLILDDYGHGTGVAGIIASNPYNLNGYNQGVAPNTHLIMLKTESSADIKQALQWIITYHTKFNIQVVNLTDFIGENRSGSFNPSVYDPELKQLHDLNIFICTPVGNGEKQFGPNVPITEPATTPYVMGAGGIDQSDSMWDDSKRGPGLDVLGPAVNVTMTYYVRNPNALTGYTPPYDDNYTGTGQLVNYAVGTSWASAYTSGVATLVKQVDPTLTPDQVTNIIASSGDLKADPVNPGTFYPRLNVENAVTKAYSVADDVYGSRTLNYNIRRAYPLRIRGGSVNVTGLKLLIGRPDVWKFTLSATSTVTLGVQYGGPAFPTCNLLNTSGRAIGAVGKRGLTMSLGAGTYYLYLTSPQSLIGAYGLTVSGAKTAASAVRATASNANATFSTTLISSTSTASSTSKRRAQVFE